VSDARREVAGEDRRRRLIKRYVELIRIEPNRMVSYLNKRGETLTQQKVQRIKGEIKIQKPKPVHKLWIW
jgi:DNA primase catalytic subunit